MHYPYDPATSLLDIYSREIKNLYLHTKTNKNIHSIFVIARNQKHPACPSMGEWLNKLSYPHTVKYTYYLSIKSNTLLIHTSWMDLQRIILEQKIQSQKITWFHVLQDTWYDSIYITFLIWQNCWNGGHISGLQELKCGRGE